MKVETFSYKLAGMRKADKFIVYKRGLGTPIIAQGRRTICSVDPSTRMGMLNWRGSSHKGFAHLSTLLGAQWVEFPREFVALLVEFAPSSGDLIGTSPETGPVYIA